MEEVNSETWEVTFIDRRDPNREKLTREFSQWFYGYKSSDKVKKSLKNALERDCKIISMKKI